MRLPMKLLIILIFVLTICGCGKKDTIVITNENREAVLLQYGKENPEKKVTIETAFGAIHLRLYEETPLHRANFIKLIKDGYYD